MLLFDWKVLVLGQLEARNPMRDLLMEISICSTIRGEASINLRELNSIAVALDTTCDELIARIDKAQEQGWLAPMQWCASRRAFKTRLTEPMTLGS